jgi:hypothetical protein
VAAFTGIMSIVSRHPRRRLCPLPKMFRNAFSAVTLRNDHWVFPERDEYLSRELPRFRATLPS